MYVALRAGRYGERGAHTPPFHIRLHKTVVFDARYIRAEAYKTNMQTSNGGSKPAQTPRATWHVGGRAVKNAATITINSEGNAKAESALRREARKQVWGG